MTDLRGIVEAAALRLERSPHPGRARRDAETLLLHVLRKGRAWLIAHDRDALAEEAEEYFQTLIDRRVAGEPMQYIVGEAEFYGLPFRVTPDVLIPRPETEHLVEKTLAVAARWERPRIVDIGAGSGAIAVALARQLASAQVTAVDISAAALEIARGNAQRNAIAGRIRFVESDLLKAIADEEFEIVVSNPPYVPQVDQESLSVEVRDHEPALALFAGDDGLDVYRRLIPAAHEVLVAGGSIVLEIGYGQLQAVAVLLESAGFVEIEFAPDLQGIPRVASARRV